MRPTAVAAVLVLLTGCGAASPEVGTTGGGAGAAPSVVEPDAGPAPAWFTDREPLPACPQVDLAQGSASVPAASERCLLDGSQGSGAELLVTAPTVEGDLVLTYYRVRPGAAGIEVVRDSSRDRYRGSPGDGWSVSTCPDATGTADLGRCRTQ